MTPVIVVQARTGSTRLPGKVLAPLGGRPMLRYQLDRLLAGTRHLVVVATSTLDRDDEVDALAATTGVECVRGSEADVLARFVAVLDVHPEADAVIRLTGDCPLVDPALVEEVWSTHVRAGADYTSNVFPRTYPKGLDVEVVSAAALRTAAAESVDPDEREHVLPFVYRRPGRFRLERVVARTGDGDQAYELDLGHARWVVDTEQDLHEIRRIVDHFAPRTDYGWREILAAFPVASRADAGVSVRRATRRDADFVLALRNDPSSVRWSETRRAVTPSEHARWFGAHCDDPATRLFIVQCEGEDVGQIRLDIDDAVGRVSIAIAEQHRGRGVGVLALRTVQAGLRGDMQVSRLQARVATDNHVSRSAFESCGFTTVGESDGFRVYEWLQVTGSSGREDA